MRRVLKRLQFSSVFCFKYLKFIGFVVKGKHLVLAVKIVVG